MKTKPLLFVISTIIILSIPFVWNDWPSLSKKIDPNKMEAWASLLAAAFTSITVYLLYKQNLQQEQAKHAAIQPDLHPAEVWITSENDLRVDENDRELISPMFKVLDSTNENDNQFARSIYGVLHNIGLGAAKEIKVNWLYDEDELLKFIGTNYHIGNMYPMDGFGSGIKYDFIPAASKINFALPRKYLLCCGLDFLGTYTKKKPELHLQIAYKDIYNNLIVKWFDVKIAILPSSFILSFKVSSLRKKVYETL